MKTLNFKKWIVNEADFVPYQDKGKEFIDRISASGLKFTTIPDSPRRAKRTGSQTQTGSIVGNYSYRYIVIVNVNGTNIPFYQSTGEGGKENVAAGKWYPFFGIGPDGWMNKGSEEQINSYYGSNLLKNIGAKLDSTTGDIREMGYTNYIVNVKEGEPAVGVINNGLSPASHNDSKSVFANINAVMQKLGTPQAQTPQAQTPQAQTPQAQTPQAQTPQAQTPQAQTPQATWKYGSNDPKSKAWGGNDSRNFQTTPTPTQGWKYGSNDPKSKAWGGNDSRNFQTT